MKNKNRKNAADSKQKPTDNSIFVPQREKLKSELHIFKRNDLTSIQTDFLKLALDKNVKLIFLYGPAGSSKTFLSIMVSLLLLNNKITSDLVYLRSIVESSDSHLGYLKGDLSEKVSVYLQPLLDKLDELLPKNEIQILHKENRIHGLPINFLRGINWNAQAIVADECQNMTYKELTTLITRMGQFSKIFICGDPDQSDINGKSGFVKMINNFNDEESRKNGIHVFKLTDNDIVRSELVKFIIKKLRTCV